MTLDIVKDFSELSEKIESADKEEALLLLGKFEALRDNYKKQLKLTAEMEHALRLTVEKAEMIILGIKQRHKL